MEKILQILAVFGLLMLLIYRAIRGWGPGFRPYGYLMRMKPPLEEGLERRLVRAVFGGGEGGADEGSGLRGRDGAIDEAGGISGADRVKTGIIDGVQAEGDAFIWDEGRQLLFCYSWTGRLVIIRRSGQDDNRQVQELAAPPDCIGVALDPQEEKLYFEAGGYIFVYGQG